MGVEFFFICSGIFMAASGAGNTEKPIAKDTLHFIWKKIKGLMPNYYVAWVIAFTVVNAGVPIRTIARNLVMSMWELLGLVQAGFSSYTANSPTWYLSAMLLAMFGLYPLMKKYKDTFFYILAPILVIFMAGVSYREFRDASLEWAWTWKGFYLEGMFRAVMEIMLGCVCYKAALWIRGIRWTAFARGFLALAEVLGYTGSAAYMYSTINTRFDWCVMVFLAVSATITFSNVSMLSCLNERRRLDAVLRWLGKYSYSLFLGNWMWAKQLGAFFPVFSWEERLMCYLLLSFATGLVIMYVSEGLRLLWKRHGRKAKAFIVSENR